MAKKWIYALEELGQEHINLVGRKCANLGEMTKLGMRVPPGFAISVDGFENYMQVTGLGKRIETYFASLGEDLKKSVQKQMDASRAAKDMIAKTPLPASIVDEIVSNYEALCARCGEPDLPVAVRSSGSVSMPGQMETYLHVRGSAEVTRRVLEVWESTFNTRAIAFRLEKGMPVDKAPIGVAVIRMVNAKSAGVLLTVIPTTGDTDRVVIEGNWGLGESVVAGEINPDSFTVNKASMSIEKKVNKKTRCVVSTANGTVKADVPFHLQDMPCLEDEEIRELVRIALGVEKHFGMPQDMEWVVDQDLSFPENVIWVQARPAKFTAQRKEAEADYIVDQMARLFRR
ncbi:MAG: PEP/pyruvate-binding domain-containing protein [Proteobacteria bacterium]|nr:PEP/pyruvate-binding domain-containing protein [Pseudomonadota bacterium]